MRFIPLLPLLLLPALLAACSGTSIPLSGPAYPIKMHRPMKSGDRFDIHITAEQTQTRSSLSEPALPHDNRTLKADLTGQLTIFNADANGSPRGLSLTIRTFTDGSATLLPPGAVILISIGEKETTVQQRGGAALPDAAAEALKLIFSPFPQRAATDDDVYGSPTPRHVGESWPMNADTQASLLRTLGWQIDPAALRGRTTLTGLNTLTNLPALRLTSTLDVTGGTPPELPVDAHVDSYQSHAQIDTQIAVDPTATAFIREVKTDGTLRLHLTDPPAKWELKVHSSQRAEYTPAR